MSTKQMIEVIEHNEKEIKVISTIDDRGTVSTMVKFREDDIFRLAHEPLKNSDLGFVFHSQIVSDIKSDKLVLNITC